MYDIGSLHIHSNSRHSSALPCVTARFSFCSTCRACTWASFFPASCVLYKRAHLPPFQSLNSIASEKELEKGKVDGTGMYMWTTHHEEYWLLVGKLSSNESTCTFLQMESQELALPRDFWQRIRILMCKQMTELIPLLKTGLSFEYFRNSTTWMWECWRSAQQIARTENYCHQRCLICVRKCFHSIFMVS